MGMPEYLAPGVYVEEVSFRSKSIEGVSTTTTGFIGPARFGPINLVPDVLTSLNDFEAVYGDRQQLDFGAGLVHNYLWHAVRAFFEEGGKRLYFVRVFTQNDADDGRASAPLPGAGDNGVLVRARFPGFAGNMHVRFTLRVGQNVLSGTRTVDPLTGQATGFTPRVGSLLENDVIWISHPSSPAGSPAESGDFYLAQRIPAPQGRIWQFTPIASSPAGGSLTFSDLTFDPDPSKSDVVRIVTLTVSVTPDERNALPRTWPDNPLHPDHQRDGAPDSLTARFAEMPLDLDSARNLPIVITVGNAITDGLTLLEAFFNAKQNLRAKLEDAASNDPRIRASSSDLDRSVDI